MRADASNALTANAYIDDLITTAPPFLSAQMRGYSRYNPRVLFQVSNRQAGSTVHAILPAKRMSTAYLLTCRITRIRFPQQQHERPR